MRKLIVDSRTFQSVRWYLFRSLGLVLMFSGVSLGAWDSSEAKNSANSGDTPNERSTTRLYDLRRWPDQKTVYLPESKKENDITPHGWVMTCKTVHTDGIVVTGAVLRAHLSRIDRAALANFPRLCRLCFGVPVRPRLSQVGDKSLRRLTIWL